jgi:hypothetical protein
MPADITKQLRIYHQVFFNNLSNGKTINGNGAVFRFETNTLFNFFLSVICNWLLVLKVRHMHIMYITEDNLQLSTIILHFCLSAGNFCKCISQNTCNANLKDKTKRSIHSYSYCLVEQFKKMLSGKM